MCLCGKDEIPACVCAGSGAGAGRLGAMATRPARGAGIPEHRGPRCLLGCAAPHGVVTGPSLSADVPHPNGDVPLVLVESVNGRALLIKEER